MALFDRLDRITSRAVDHAFAAEFWILPQSTRPNGRAIPDPDRETIVGKGVLDEEPVHSPIETGNRDRAGNDFRSLVNGYDFQLSVDRTRYPAIDKARQGDRVTLDDTRKFRVVSVQRDGLSRVVLVLSRA